MGLGWDAGLFVECPALGDKGRDYASERGVCLIPAREIYGEEYPVVERLC